MIRVENLHVVFNPGSAIENHALRGVSLTIPTGAFVTVIGSNGAGKSTLLGALSGEVSPTRGRIGIEDQDVTFQPVHKRAKLAARVFQDPLAGTCAPLTIEENMALALKRGGSRGFGMALREERRALFRERLKPLGLGLENRLSDRIGLLSGGQRQAVSLVMATLAPSRILLLDEHTAALDPRMAKFVLELTREVVAQYGLTTLMVTHSMADALAHGSRTIMLHQGQIALDVSDPERQSMTIGDLLEMFSKVRGEEIKDDKLLLS